ncbi:MAG: prepilin-type N-terminal cleavage/methylation domain-containing protein [Moraxellaceae bacterium]
MPVTVKTQSSQAIICPLATIAEPLGLNRFEIISISSYHRNVLTTSTKDSLLTSSLSTKRATQTGFTLVEIVVVVVILSIFAGMMSLSVGSSESRKNRAFYEHLADSLSYVRLLSAERMQPMGLRLQADKQGQVAPVIVTLSNPYIAYQTADILVGNRDSQPKNAMELSADLSSLSDSTGETQPTPSWEVESEVSLPELPAGVSIRVQSLDASNSTSTGQTQTLQPWFSDQSVPQVLWFGTGQATPVTIEVVHDSRLIGEVMTIMPDGSIMIGQERS